MVNRSILLKRQELLSTARDVGSKQYFPKASSSDCNIGIANINHTVFNHMVYPLIKMHMTFFRRFWFVMFNLPQCQDTKEGKLESHSLCSVAINC